MTEKEKNNKITIYLLKKDYNDENVIKSEYIDDEENINTLYSSDNCKTYIAYNRLKTPIWVKSFYESNGNEIKSAYPKVVSIYTINIDEKNICFAVPFGGGKSMIKNDSFVEDFGLKVLLNSVDNNSFRQLQIADCGKNFRNTASQLPKLGSIDDFMFDFNTEMLKKAVAKCADKLFANNNIVGGDGLTITGPYKCDTVENLLTECYKRYQSNKYKDNFAWLDNIREVKDSILKTELEKELVSLINKKEFDKVWMSVPNMIDWDRIKYFKFKKSNPEYDDIMIEEFIKLFEDQHIDSFENIKNRSVSSYDFDDKIVDVWSANKCLMAELSYGDNEYCYNSGKWFLINKDYGKQINEYYNQIPIYKESFVDYDNSCEKEYNIKLSKSIKDSIVMDCRNIEALEKGRNPVELCDVLTRNRELIHIKKGESSSYLSHLFNQARVSSDLLCELKFREKANVEIDEDFFDSSFSPKDFTIVLGIITKKDGKIPKIPFFSKVAIKYLNQDLTKMGYRLNLINIHNIKKD